MIAVIGGGHKGTGGESLVSSSTAILRRRRAWAIRQSPSLEESTLEESTVEESVVEEST